jgi:hypothetical protein
MTTKRHWKSKQLPRVFTVRATENEYERMKELADAAELSLSRLLIDAAINGQPRNTSEIREDKKLIERAIYELNKIGTNLNQLTRQTNASLRGHGEPATRGELKEIQAGIKELIQRLLDEL